MHKPSLFLFSSGQSFALPASCIEVPQPAHCTGHIYNCASLCMVHFQDANGHHCQEFGCDVIVSTSYLEIYMWDYVNTQLLNS